MSVKYRSFNSSSTALWWFGPGVKHNCLFNKLIRIILLIFLGNCSKVHFILSYWCITKIPAKPFNNHSWKMRVIGHFMTVVHWDQAMSCCPSLTILLPSKPLKWYQKLNIHTCYFFTTYLCLWMCAKSKQKIDTNLPLSFPWPPYIEKKNTCMLNDQYIPIFQEDFVSNIQVRFCPILNQHPRSSH